jgi:hypothetical protein
MKFVTNEGFPKPISCVAYAKIHSICALLLIFDTVAGLF